MFSKSNLSILVLLTSFIASAQSEFLPGYFITKDGQKTECEILYLEWDQNPEKIKYKNDQGTIMDISSEDISEFEIIGVCKYVSRSVKMDISSVDMKNLSTSKAPEWKDVTTMMKVLLEGEITLLSSSLDGFNRLFYENEEGTNQLIYKKYYVNEGDQIATNKNYIGQMNVVLNCQEAKKWIVNASYNEKSIYKAFKAYYECMDLPYKIYEANEAKPEFQWYVSVGILNNTFSGEFVGASVARNFSSNSELAYSFGFETELPLPVRNNTWRVHASPSFVSRSLSTLTDKVPNSAAESFDVDIKMNTIEIPIGIRYYVFLGENSSLRFGVAAAVNVVIGESAIYYEKDTNSATASTWEFENYLSFQPSIGFVHKNLAVDLSHSKANELLSDLNNFIMITNVTTTSIRFAYRLK